MTGLVSDVMHDLLERVLPLEVKDVNILNSLLLNHGITSNYILSLTLVLKQRANTSRPIFNHSNQAIAFVDHSLKQTSQYV